MFPEGGPFVMSAVRTRVSKREFAYNLLCGALSPLEMQETRRVPYLRDNEFEDLEVHVGKLPMHLGRITLTQSGIKRCMSNRKKRKYGKILVCCHVGAIMSDLYDLKIYGWTEIQFKKVAIAALQSSKLKDD